MAGSGYSQMDRQYRQGAKCGCSRNQVRRSAMRQLLQKAGNDALIVERQSGDHVLTRIRAGILEQVCIDQLDQAGVGERMHREDLVHGGFEMLYNGRRHCIDLNQLTGGKNVIIYGQTELTHDLMYARVAADRRQGPEPGGDRCEISLQFNHRVLPRKV